MIGTPCLVALPWVTVGQFSPWSAAPKVGYTHRLPFYTSGFE